MTLSCLLLGSYEEEVFNALYDEWCLCVDEVDGVLDNNKEVVPHHRHLFLQLLLFHLQLAVAHAHNLQPPKIISFIIGINELLPS